MQNSTRNLLDLSRLKVYPLETRKSLTEVEHILVDPDSPAKPCSDGTRKAISNCAQAMVRARKNGAKVMMIYGAHLLRNGAALILERMMKAGWIGHLATNGAGTIHDWEYAFLGRSTESVEDNVSTGKFGTWDETSRFIHLSLLVGSLRGEGYGTALGRFIEEGELVIPTQTQLETDLKSYPSHPLSAAKADLLLTLVRHQIPSGTLQLAHRWKYASILAAAFRANLPMTVHPGIGYDIISNHPMFNGAVLGRAAEIDFKIFANSVDHLDGGVVMSIGSAIMGPQVFEKTLSCANNLRCQVGTSIVSGHSIFVVDLQDGGNWDWTTGEPPKSNPAYYLRFCKSYSRMGGAMHYVQSDNLNFVHHLYHALRVA